MRHSLARILPFALVLTACGGSSTECFLNSIGQAIAEGTEPLGPCGTHVVDFEHNP